MGFDIGKDEDGASKSDREQARSVEEVISSVLKENQNKSVVSVHKWAVLLWTCIVIA
jgi:hypothetical protein